MSVLGYTQLLMGKSTFTPIVGTGGTITTYTISVQTGEVHTFLTTEKR